jgi:preprotein translocase subunit SecY
VSIFGGGITPNPRGGAGLTMPLLQTFRQAWADPDLKGRLIFILAMFGVFVLGINIPVPIPGVNQAFLADAVKNIPLFAFMNIMGGGAVRRLSIFALGLNPYITSQIIMQVLTTAIPQWKKDLEEGGDYARQQQAKRSRGLSLFLCFAQGYAFYAAMAGTKAVPYNFYLIASTLIFWTAGSMFMVWLGEQISQKGIGNGVSLMIFAGICLSAPAQFGQLWTNIQNRVPGSITTAIVDIIIFLGTAWVVVLFTTSQRRIPMQHMRRQFGTKTIGGQTSYLPIPVNTAGVIPLIFAISLLYIPQQVAMFISSRNPKLGAQLMDFTGWLSPAAEFPKNLVGCLFYAVLIFFFTYFYTAIQYNVEDIANNLKRGGSFIPGVRPGKQTKDFLDAIISRVTIAGAAFLTVVALAQYIGPALSGQRNMGLNVIGGTSLLIMVQVAIETMRQIEASLLMKQYGN